MFFFLSLGYSLSCSTCVSTTSSSCSGSSVVCPSGYSCGAAYSQSTSGGSVAAISYAKACTPTSQCSTSGSLSVMGGIKMKMVSACCTTDNCTPTLPSLPSDNSSYNQLVCRTCASADSTWCYTSDTIQCTGNENRCLLMTTKVTGSSSASAALRGCATQSICDIGSQSSSVDGLTSDVKFICTSGSPTLRYSFYLPALIGLLLLKLLF
ncbi:phospholipase A2 inhibitor and Ly6/PLAUR domain-containing protein-like [Hyperolius riggenbachi]|uniref:phospholipase A2 inhibitor and Ly6/PLAUR domain-containing protein-like n=1 Tax=Hyperolius riggenbachi TaxID=752182 RepID=UPI0035A3B79F